MTEENVGRGRMTAVELRRTRRQRMRSAKRSVIVVIYAIAGPPLGSLVFLLSFYAVELRRGIVQGLWDSQTIAELIQVIPATIGFYFFTFPFAYMFGGAQALIAGAIVALLAGSSGRFGYRAAAGAALIVGIAALPILVFAFEFPLPFALSLGGVGIAASLLIRLLFGRLFAQTAGR